MENIHPLRDYRERQTPPLTQEQLAKQLGTTKATVSRWETGERKPEPEELPKIEAKTGIPPRLLRPDIAEIFNPPRRSTRAKGAAKSRAA